MFSSKSGCGDDPYRLVDPIRVTSKWRDAELSRPNDRLTGVKLSGPRLRIALCVIGLALPAGAAEQTAESLRAEIEQEGFVLRADEVEYDTTRELYVASGNVRIDQPGGRHLTADWVAFSEESRLGVATGDVRIVYGEDTLRAQFAAVDFDRLVALLTDGELIAERTGFVVEGLALEKTGEETYHVRKGTFTTCRCPAGHERRPFEVDAEDTDIRVGGYAVARNVTVRVLGFPVGYTPWLILPVKTERQSGFLPPRYSSTGRGGSWIELPFFWAARPNLNVLLRPGWIAKRGFHYGLDHEYVFGEDGWGEGGMAFLPGDDEVTREDPDTRFSNDRWAFWLRHQQTLGSRAQVGLDLLEMSDNSHVLDFEELPSSVRSMRFSESTAWGAYAGAGLVGDVQIARLDDLQSPNDLDRDDRLLDRLPDVALSVLPRSLGPLPLRGAFDLRYTYFWQEDHSRTETGTTSGIPSVSPFSVRDQFFDTGLDGTFDGKEEDATGQFPGGVDVNGDNFDPLLGVGTEGNGVFDEGEPLADFGHRLDFYPRLLFTRRLGVIESLSEVGFRETLYFPNRGDSETRELWTGRVDTRVRIDRDYRVGDRTLRHVVEPSVGGGFVSRQQQADNPLFVPEGEVPQSRIQDGDLRVRLRNPTDRIEDERFVLGALANRLFLAPDRPGEAARQVAEVRVSSGYDFERDRALDLFLTAEVEPVPGVGVELDLGFDPKESHLAEARAALRIESRAGHDLAVSYRYIRDIPPFFEDYRFSSDVWEESDPDFDRIDELSFSARYRVTRRIEAFGDLLADFEESRIQSSSVGVRVGSRCDCWDVAVSIRERTRPSDTSVQVEFRITGLNR